MGGSNQVVVISALWRIHETERISHYFMAKIAEQFDAAIHVDATRAVEPLDGWQDVSDEVVPETFPSGV